MFALIKREIEDNIVYFLGAVIFTTILIAIVFYKAYQYNSKEPPIFSGALSFLLVLVLIIGCGAMGAGQMYIDRTRKISSFLSTLVVTRRQILLARIITGILAILTVLVPLTITTVILLRLFAPLIQLYDGLVLEIFTGTFLTSFACYCLGLQIGFSSSKITRTLGSVVLTLLLVTVIYVKGFSLNVVLILSAFIVASLICTWQKFMSTSL